MKFYLKKNVLYLFCFRYLLVRLTEKKRRCWAERSSYKTAILLMLTPLLPHSLSIFFSLSFKISFIYSWLLLSLNSPSVSVLVHVVTKHFHSSQKLLTFSSFKFLKDFLSFSHPWIQIPQPSTQRRQPSPASSSSISQNPTSDSPKSSGFRSRTRTQPTHQATRNQTTTAGINNNTTD